MPSIFMNNPRLRIDCAMHLQWRGRSFARAVVPTARWSGLHAMKAIFNAGRLHLSYE